MRPTGWGYILPLGHNLIDLVEVYILYKVMLHVHTKYQDKKIFNVFILRIYF